MGIQISVVVPTLNRFNDLNSLLKQLLKQNFKNFEVIIIDQSDKKYNFKSEEFKLYEFKYIHSKLKSASAARNIGIKLSKGEVILFLDDDVIISNPNFLNNHYRHYQDEEIFGVVGSTFEYSKDELPGFKRKNGKNILVDWLNFPRNYGCHTFVASGRSNNLSVRRECAIAVGGMDENYEKGAHREEADFCIRIYRKYGAFLFDPQARLIHIGNKIGGIRSWNDNQFVKAKHHMVGAIYFVLHTAPKKYFPIFVLDMFRYFLINKTILKRPQLWALTTSRMFSAFFEALKKHRRGGIYLIKVDKHS